MLIPGTVLAGLLVAVQDDAAKLADAAKKSADWKSYKFTISDGAKKGGTSDGVYEKDKALIATSGKTQSVTAGGKTVYQGKDGTWSDQAGKGGKKGKKDAKAPHELVAEIDKQFSKVTASSEADGTVYSGDLTTDGASALSGVKTGKSQAKGSAKVTVGKDGQISKLEITLTVSGAKGDRTIARTITFSEINTAKAEIPEEAKKALGL